MVSRIDPHIAARYAAMLDAVLTAGGRPAAVRPPVDGPPDTVAVEHGEAWPRLAADPGSAAAFDLLGPLLAPSFEPDAVAVADRAGHARPAYRGLLGYALFQAVRASDRVLVGDQAAAASRWLDALRPDLALLGRGPWAAAGPAATALAGVPAARGDDAVRAAWAAMAVHAGGELAHDDRAVAEARACLHGLVARQQPAGTFLLPGAGDNLESFWFHELQLLQAVASFGLQTHHPSALAAAARAAAYHVAETQPDHATNEPWGLPAFLLDPDGVTMADQLLHSAGVQQPGRAGGVTLILLADTLYSLRRHRAG